MSQPPLPIDLIEGPARVYLIMGPDTYYTTTELSEQAQISNSTCQRHLDILTKRNLIQRFAGSSIRGRPAFFYALKDKKESPSS